MSTYLEKNKPRVPQYRTPRRAAVSGLFVIHTAENVMDTVGVDTGAENVAAFIANRTDYGSYHCLADSDSWVHLVPYTAEAYGDGTGSNPFAIHISFACRTVDWKNMSISRRDGFLNQGVKATTHAYRWLQSQGLPTPPLKQISRAESSARKPGFIGHGARDPGRRSDPGADFPWGRYFALLEKELNPVKPKRRPPRVRRAYRAAGDQIQEVRVARENARKRGEAVKPYNDIIRGFQAARQAARTVPKR